MCYLTVFMICYVFQLTIILGAMVNYTAELYTYMVSVERVEEYCHVPQEVSLGSGE